MTARHLRYDEPMFSNRRQNKYDSVDRRVLAIYYLNFPELRNELDFNTQILPGLQDILGYKVKFEDLANDSEQVREQVRIATRKDRSLSKIFNEAQRLRIETPTRNNHSIKRHYRIVRGLPEEHYHD